MLVPTVGEYAHAHFRAVGCEHDAATRAEKNKGYRHRPPNQKRTLWRPAYINYKKVQKMTSSTRTDAIFGGADCSRMVAK